MFPQRPFAGSNSFQMFANVFSFPRDISIKLSAFSTKRETAGKGEAV